ncbi:MAG: Mg2 transporter protein CorA family protein [Francisellaceae bacterium]|nr:Mg2 transporter protein CorA family protein [Francisellaceae bacterium]
MDMKIFKDTKENFEWIDILNPTLEELSPVVEKYGLHPTSIQDCFDPRHLPKFEQIDNITFIILRTYDDASSELANTIHALTRKISIFIGPNFLISIHRTDLPFLHSLYANPFKNFDPIYINSKLYILNYLIQEILYSYEKLSNLCETSLSLFEENLLNIESISSSLQEKMLQRSRINVFKSMIRFSIDIISKLKSHFNEGNQPIFQNLKENAENINYYAEELTENITNLITLQISLSAHNTNEIMRTLTLFSVFFMPLTFIVGIYGMNFKFMPELEWKYSYPILLILMATVSMGIFIWFKKKKWLKF